jgi:diguanylate cyclase (GGDEF)-like protein
LRVVLYAQLNIFALLLLLLVYLNLRRPSKSYFAEQKLFLRLIIADALILLLDTGMWIFDGAPGLRTANLAVTACYYIANPVLSLIWMLYAQYQINGDDNRIRSLFLPIWIPAAINLVLSVMSVFGNYLFYIDQNNFYHRGRFYPLVVFISYSYLMHAFGYALKRRKSIAKNKLLPILLFPIPPLLGSLIQNFFFGVSLIWVCATISILVVFINIQNTQLYTDHLTGLYNRRQLDHYIMEKLKNREGALAGIMLDIDGFKKINDVFGHETGDLALEHTAKILRDTFRRDDFIARYGGDEFVVMLKMENSSDLITAIERLNDNIRKFNARKVFPFEINLSVGYDYYNYMPGATMQEFFRHIDSLMYEDKLSRKKASIGV